MLGIFKHRKLKKDKIAGQFVDQFLPSVDEGFPEVAALINESPEFVKDPNIDPLDSDKFLLITLSANLIAVQDYFPPHVDQEISRYILEFVAEQTETDYVGLSNTIGKNQKLISKVNHPSKNLVYGMSKAIFYKYNLSPFQDEYFKHVNSPNPIFLKRMDEAVENFLWDWEEMTGN